MVRWGRTSAGESTAEETSASADTVEETSGTLAKWVRVVAHLRRLSFRRRIWGVLGHFLRDIKQRELLSEHGGVFDGTEGGGSGECDRDASRGRPDKVESTDTSPSAIFAGAGR